MRRSVDPQLWGACLWDALFHVAFHCRDEGNDAQMLRSMVSQLPVVLPCERCRDGTMEFCRVSSASQIPTDRVPAWLWQLKDVVNQKLRKKSRSMSFVRQRHVVLGAGRQGQTTLLRLFLLLAVASDDASAKHVAFFVQGMSWLSQYPALWNAIVLSGIGESTATRQQLLDALLGACRSRYSMHVDIADFEKLLMTQ